MCKTITALRHNICANVHVACPAVRFAPIHCDAKCTLTLFCCSSDWESFCENLTFSSLICSCSRRASRSCVSWRAMSAFSSSSWQHSNRTCWVPVLIFHQHFYTHDRHLRTLFYCVRHNLSNNIKTRQPNIPSGLSQLKKSGHIQPMTLVEIFNWHAPV